MKCNHISFSTVMDVMEFFLRFVSIDSIRHAPDGPGAETYTERLQKSMTPYITTQVNFSIELLFCCFYIALTN